MRLLWWPARALELLDGAYSWCEGAFGQKRPFGALLHLATLDALDTLNSGLSILMDVAFVFHARPVGIDSTKLAASGGSLRSSVMNTILESSTEAVNLPDDDSNVTQYLMNFKISYFYIPGGIRSRDL